MSDVLYLGETNARRRYRRFGIKLNDRFSHMWIIGRTGVGKSTLLKKMAAQDGQPGGPGFVVVDPHGDLAEDLSGIVDPSRLTYLDGAKADWRFNPIEQVEGSDPALVAANLVASFRHIWNDDWGPRLEHLVRNVVLTLLDTPGGHLGLVPRLLADRDFRSAIVRDLGDEVVRSFWFDEFDGYSDKFRSVVVAPLQNKIGALLSDSRLRSILATEESSIDVRSIMDNGGALLVDLGKGQLGEGPSSLLGSLLVSRIAAEAFARGGRPESARAPFFVYLDEFHSFTTTMLGSMLSELRKYRVGMVLAHQYLDQVEPQVGAALIGNTGTLVSFRLGAVDAARISGELQPMFSRSDLTSLPNFEMYLRLMNGGRLSRPFSARVTLPNLPSLPGTHLQLSTQAKRAFGALPLSGPE